MEDGNIQFMANEFFVNNALWALFYGKGDIFAFTNITLPSAVDTTAINFGLGGDLHGHGFEDDLPCKLAVYADPDGTPPIVRFRNDNVEPISFEA